MVYEDDNVFIYEKPAGWVCASPNPKVKTTYSAVKAYLEAKTEAMVDVHFVNKLPRGSERFARGRQVSGMETTSSNQLGQFCQGHVCDGPRPFACGRRVVLRPEQGEPYALPYRTMRATNLHTMLKFRAGYEVIKDMLPALRREDCLLIGVGKSAPDPIKSGGIHLFALALVGPEGR